MIARWKKKRKVLEEADAKKKSLGKGGKKSLSDEEEERLLRQILELRKLAIPVSGILVKLMASKIIKERAPGSVEGVSTRAFRASAGWFDNFKSRHNLSFRKGTKRAIATIPQNTLDVLSTWQRGLYDLCQRTGATHIINIDETPVFYDLMFDHTLHTTGDPEVLIQKIKNCKKRVTVILGIILPLSGLFIQKFKCKAMIIFNGQRESTIFRGCPDDPALVYACNKTAWCKEKEFIQFLEDCVPQELLASTVFTWDNFSVHDTQNVKDFCAEKKLQVLTLPPNCTAFIQPLDVAINRPFKVALKNLYRDWLLSRRPGESIEIDRPTLAKFILEAWNTIDMEMILNAFQCCGFGVRPEALNDKNCYWKRLPSLQQELDNVDPEVSATVFRERVFSDEANPSVFLFNSRA